VRTFHPEATTGWTTVNQGPVDQMTQTAIRELTGIENLGEAWKSLFPGITAESRISLKINLSCGDVPTHPQVVNSIIDGLLLMDLDGQQLPEEQIIVWDLDTAFFCAQTGYQMNYGGPGVQYFGTDHPAVGFDYSQGFVIQHPGTTSTHYPSRIITQMCDYMINVGVIKDHNDADVTLCLKNNYGSFSNVAIWPMHVSPQYGDGHSRGEPELNRVLRDELGNKTRLFVIDATFGLYYGGPGYTPPGHTPPNWAYNSLLMSLDPVACDRIGTIKINERRQQHVPPMPVYDPSHVSAAAGPPYNLGTDDPEEIDLVEIDASQQAGAPETGIAVGEVSLLPVLPNPARERCLIRFRGRRSFEARIALWDAQGRSVRTLGEGSYPAGLHRLAWDGRDDRGRGLPAGVYFCRLRSSGAVSEQRVVLTP